MRFESVTVASGSQKLASHRERRQAPVEPSSSRRLARASRSRPAVVEVMGLPGVGKTVACRALLDRPGGAKQSWISVPWLKIRKSFVPRLLVPTALLRYRRVLRALRSQSAPRWPRLRAALLHFRLRARRLRRAEDPLVSTLFLLTTSVTEIALARLEARLRRRTLILDEGFVHRALGVWIRSAPAIRDEAMTAYVDTIPPGSACILLRCDPDTALARASTRVRGVPLAAIRAAEALDTESSTNAAVSAVYREQAEVFELESLRARVQLHEVDANGTPEEVAERIEAALHGFGVERPLLVFLRK